MAKIVTPHDEDEGFVSARRNVTTDSYVVLYDGEASGFDTGDGRWILLCSAHGSMEQETNKARASRMMSCPKDWCRSCARTASRPTLTQMLVIPEKTQEAKDAEMRFWAKKTRGSEEKQFLFEQMYGHKPNLFWD